MVRKNDPLAEFLRTQRAKIQPSDVGLPTGNRRRVAGLRREEVAILAGISTDYYHRIEQGREKPSEQVLNALADAFRLSPDAAAHMRDLVHAPKRWPREREFTQPLNPALQHLIDSWPATPAHIHDVTATIVMANPLAAALTPTFAQGENPMRSLFLDEGMDRFYRNWEGLTAWAVRWLRAYVGRHPDPGLQVVIDELLSESARFRSLWASYDVKGHSRGLLLIDHPVVGPLDLHFQHLNVRTGEHIMVTYWAEPGSPSARGLQKLVEITTAQRVSHQALFGGT